MAVEFKNDDISVVTSYVPPGLSSATLFSGPMTSVKLNMTNYVLWSRSIQVFLEGKDLKKYLVDPKPKEGTPGYDEWEQADAQIISLLLNSIDANISSTLLYLDTAKEIWDHLAIMYSGTGNFTRVYEVCQQYFRLEQGNLSLADYYSHVIGVCEEMKFYHPFTTDVAVWQKQHEDMNVVCFLMGLKPEYEAVRSQILGSSSLPSLLEVFSRLQRATLSNGTSGVDRSLSHDRSALVVPTSHNDSLRSGRGNRGGRGGRGGRTGGHSGRSGSRLCTHCGHRGHTVDYCWDLHGKPSGVANQASYQDDTSRPAPPNSGTVTLTREEYAQLLSKQYVVPSSSTATFAQSGSLDEDEDWYEA